MVSHFYRKLRAQPTGGRIRIGFANERKMNQQISMLEQKDQFTGLPNPNLWYLGRFEGTEGDMQDTINRFKYLHIKWNWYKWTEELREYIREKFQDWLKKQSARLEVVNSVAE